MNSTYSAIHIIDMHSCMAIDVHFYPFGIY